MGKYGEFWDKHFCLSVIRSVVSDVLVIQVGMDSAEISGLIPEACGIELGSFYSVLKLFHRF